MKILHLSTARTWRGGEQQLAYLIEELNRAGVENHVFCPADSEISRHCEAESILQSKYLRRSSLDLPAARRLSRLCQEKKIDIIHAHDSHGHTLLSLAGTLFGDRVPAVVSRRVDFPVTKVLSRWKYNHPNVKVIICVSERIREIMTPVINDLSRLKVVYDGIDLEKFTVKERGRLRAEFGIPAERRIVANVAAIAAHKDYTTFVNVAERLLRDGIDATFLIIGGDGGEEKKIREMIADKGLGDRIVLTGFREDIPEILPEIDLLLFTSKTEGLGTTILDAFVARRPVVATRGGGIPEIVRHEETGLLADVGDVEELAEQVTRMLSDEELRHRLSEKAWRFVQDFSKQRTAEKTLEVYRSIIGKGA